MSGPEARAWASVQRRLKNWRDTAPACPLHWQRLESGSTASGIFDLNVCFLGHETWIEMKSVPLPKKKDTIKNPLSLHQRAWGRQRAEAGGRTACLVQLRSVFSAVWCGFGPEHYAVEDWQFYMLTLDRCLLFTSSEATSGIKGAIELF